MMVGARGTATRAARRTATPAVFALVTVAVMAVHTLARDRLWRYEWLWATYQYHFGVLLLGPVLCGVAAWVGRRSGQARWLTHPAGRLGPSLQPLGIAVAAAWGAYVLAWSVPAAIVLASGTADSLSAGALVTFAPAIAAIGAYVATGFAVGVAWPSRLTPPVAAVGAFAVTMLGWIGGAERIVRLGGAGMTMAELRPTAAVQVAQVALYGLLAGGAGWWAAHRLGGGDGRRVLRGLGAAALAVALWLGVTATPMFDHPAVDDVCVHSDGVSLCAARPYSAPLRSLAPRLAPAVARLRAIGAPVEGDVLLGSTVGLFEPSPEPELLSGELFGLLGVGRCMDREVQEDVMNLAMWLAVLVGDHQRTEHLDLDPAAPTALLSHDPAVQDEWAAAALARVRSACRSAN